MSSEPAADPPPRPWMAPQPRKAASVGLLTYSTVLLLPYAAAFALCGTHNHEETVLYTKRVHRVMLPLSDEREFGDISFNSVKKELGNNVLGPFDPNTLRVCRIANDIIHGTHRLLLTKSPCDDDSCLKGTGPIPSGSQNKQGKVAVLPQAVDLGELNWELIVVRDKRANAESKWGGKIIVNIGLLECLDTDAEIAAILAHKIGHVVARHALEFNEVVALFIPFLSRLMPFSRRKEIEADHIGIMLLAAASFDPRVASVVYQKLGNTGGDHDWEDYIGSHPSFKTRSQFLSQSKAMEDAVELYHRQLTASLHMVAGSSETLVSQ